MIKGSTIEPGLTFTDPNDTKAGVYWRTVHKTEIGGLLAREVTAKIDPSSKEFKPHELPRLLPVNRTPLADVDLAPLIGEKVIIDTRFGRNTGVVVGLIGHELDLLGKCSTVHFGLVLSGGEEYTLGDITKIEKVAQ